MKDKEIMCLVPGCTKQPNTRGLCKNHYTMACQLVGKNKTTWKILINEKKCTEPTGRKNKGATGWFLNRGEQKDV